MWKCDEYTIHDNLFDRISFLFIHSNNLNVLVITIIITIDNCFYSFVTIEITMPDIYLQEIMHGRETLEIMRAPAI